MIQLDTTICAISTAPGVGGIAVIRVSGKQAICLSDKIFKAKKSLLEQSSDMAVFGRIVDSEAKVIDEVIELFKNYNTKQIVDMMHEEEAYKNTPEYQQISYKYAKNLSI